MEVSFATFYDESLPPSNLTNQSLQAACCVTTGGFPHEAALTTAAASANVSRIALRFSDAKEVVVNIKKRQGDVVQIAATTLEKESGKDVQDLVLDLDDEKGKELREIQIQVLSGYSEFVGIYRVNVIGEESLQKFATIQKSEEIAM